MKLLSFLLFCILFSTLAQAQDLPIGLTDEEKSKMHMIGANRAVTPPPFGPVRAVAEWDESIGVFTLWKNPGLIKEIQKDSEVYIVTTNSSWWDNYLTSNGIPLTNIHYLIAPTNSIYTRDFGPWFIWDGNNEFGMVDNIYNRPRPDDDLVPEVMSRVYQIPYYGMDLVHTGGNYYTDGWGNAWSSMLVFYENSKKTKAQVLQIMQDYLGIDQYVTPDLKYSIMHFDTYGKILSPDTILWGSFPEKTTPWIYNEATYKYYQTLQSAYGWPYKIHRIPLWSFGSSWTAYINSLMTNKKILTAKYNTSHDQEAKEIYENSAKGYKVKNIDAMGTNWGDSIHCRTRNYHKGDAIRIYPKPHWEVADDQNSFYKVVAEVIPHPSTTLNGDPNIYWTVTGGAPFNRTQMAATGNVNEYEGAIPGQAVGALISYYIRAEDMTGHSKVFPFVAPDGMFTIQVEDDVTVPDLDHDAIHGLTVSDWPLKLSCVSVDKTGIPEVSIQYRINGRTQPDLVMEREEGTFKFSGMMTGQIELRDVISYRILSRDSSSPFNTASNPKSGWNTFIIDNKNSILVIDLDVSPDTGAKLINVCDDLGLNAHYVTSWPSNLSNYDVVMICLGMKYKNKYLNSIQANELISFLNAGGAAYMEGGQCFYNDSASIIYNPYFGLANTTDGQDLNSPVKGVIGQVTEGMSFKHYGEWASSDNLYPSPSAKGVLKANSFFKGVTYSTGTYNTAAVSLQTSDLVDDFPFSTFKALTVCFLRHLGMNLNLTVSGDMGPGEEYCIDIEGDDNANFMLYYSLAPGYLPMGSTGVLQIDLQNMKLLYAGALPSNGRLSVTGRLPNIPALIGEEIYFQAYMEGLGHYFLSNRDRLR